MTRASTTVVACDFPPRSVLDRVWVDSAYFRDSYRFPLSRPTIGVVEVFHAPQWSRQEANKRTHTKSPGTTGPFALEVNDENAGG